MDREVFFPASDDREGREAAIAICGPCPVRNECRAFASELNSYGVFGGQWFGPNEDAIGVGRPRKPREHGTPRGYRQHQYRNEPVCDACREAMQLVWAQQTAARGPRRRKESVA
jgi:hypothetical protein